MMFEQLLTALFLTADHAENMWTRAQILKAYQNGLAAGTRGFLICK